MKKKINIFIISVFLFLIGDYIVSINTNLFNVRKDCFNFVKKSLKNINYYYYNLKSNCFAIEHKGVSNSYNVFTNQIGSRVKDNNKNNSSKEKIIFLGDSFTYGFGLDYEKSIPGLIDKKTNNKYEIINFGFMGYSPSMNYYLLKKYIDNFPNAKIKKVFYILDITDVHDEANRWVDVAGLDMPVILDESIRNEIKQEFDLRQKFRATRYLSYIFNKNLRNFRKKLKNIFYTKNNVKNSFEEKSYWAKFIYTNKNALYIDNTYSNLWLKDEFYGINKIKDKTNKISSILKKSNIDFYITIHPWKEVLEYGQTEFSWENFGQELCILTKCKKLINFFDVMNEIKDIDPNWKSNFYLKSDIHFSAKGNEEYALKILKESFN